MQEVLKFHIVGSSKCENTKIAREMLTYDGETAYSYTDVENAKWLKLIVSKSELKQVPIIFDHNLDLIGGLEDLKKYLENSDIPTESTRLSSLIRKAIRRRSV